MSCTEMGDVSRADLGAQMYTRPVTAGSGSMKFPFCGLLLEHLVSKMVLSDVMCIKVGWVGGCSLCSLRFSK